ncbi:MAG: ABC transporter permease, partial [Methanoregula sp.]|nr:ABC transporter permease [Methanoregula sp.]
FRTGLSGYRKAAYWGVLYGALGTLGFIFTLAGESVEIFGLALILAALYLQGRMVREKIWTGKEPTLVRALGSVKRP